MLDLAYPLDDSAMINGIEYKLDLSFDNVLRLIDMLSDGEISDILQIETGLKMLIGADLDMDIEEKEKVFFDLFQSTIGKEADEGQPVDIQGNPMPEIAEKEAYDLKQDAAYIYASFMSDYGIDLFGQQGRLHWDKFKALLGGLTDGSKFLRVIEIRTMELPEGKGSGKQRNEILKLKKVYELKDDD